MNVALNILIVLLGNEKLVNFIVGLLEGLKDKPDNAVNPEYVELAKESLTERVINNRVPADGNVMLPQADIERIKAQYRESLHEQV